MKKKQINELMLKARLEAGVDKDFSNPVKWLKCQELTVEKTEKATAKEIFEEIEKSFKEEIWRNSYLNPQNKLQNLKKKFGVEEK